MGFMIDAAVCSSIGGRQNNEDNFYLNGQFMGRKQMDKGGKLSEQNTQPVQVYAVFDGMGGGDFGEYASYYAASELKKYQDGREEPDAPEALHAFLTDVSRGIDKISEEHGLRSGSCGSTAALLILGQGWYRTAHVGDSRVYHLRDGELARLTKDQSAVQRMVDAGAITQEEAWSHPRKNVITHHLGMPLRGGELQSVIGERIGLREGDLFLLCSDGVSDSLRDEEILQVLDPSDSAEVNAGRITQTARKHADDMGVQSDNITAVVLRVLQSSDEQQLVRVKKLRRRRAISGTCAALFALGAAGALFRLLQIL